jgi:hypothetical protein
VRQSKWKEFLFLLRREFLFQLDGRRAYSRGVYPGVNWFALICVGALLLEFNASRLAPESSSTAIDHFTFLTLAQVFLITLRSTVYCALSVSRDLQNHTATVVRVSPVSRTVTLAAKLCACLAPLWIELILFLPVSVLFFSVYLWLSPVLVASTLPFLIAVSLMAGCLGLVIGSTTALPHQAARNARLFVFFLLFVMPVLEGMSEGWMIPLIALGLWLSVTTRRAPHRTTLMASFAGLLTMLGLLHSRAPLGFSLSNLHPLHISGEFYSNPLHGGDLHLWLDQAGLFAHPLAMGLVYLGLAVFFFLLARTRYSYAR